MMMVMSSSGMVRVAGILLVITSSALGFLHPVLKASPSTYRGATFPATTNPAAFAPRLERWTPQAQHSSHRGWVCRTLSMEVDESMLRLQAAELGDRLKGTNLYFVGMMGTGKSAVARAIADVMGRYVFLDTDAVIEELLGAPVSEIFEQDGEEAFRSVESQVLDQAHSFVKMCIATGGGMVTQRSNWGKLQTGLVVWLDMEVQDIVDRLLRKGDEEVQKRPLLAGGDPAAKLSAILEERRSFYDQADVKVKVEAGEGVDDVAMNVVMTLLQFIDSNPPKWQQWQDKARSEGIDWA